jgi:hypothetical protein
LREGGRDAAQQVEDQEAAVAHAILDVEAVAERELEAEHERVDRDHRDRHVRRRAGRDDVAKGNHAAIRKWPLPDDRTVKLEARTP